MRKKIFYMTFVIIIFTLNCAFINQFKAIKDLEYSFEKFNIAMPSFGKFALLADIGIYNPNGVNIEITSLEYTVKIGKIVIAEGESFERLKIKKKSKEIYHTKINLKLNNLDKTLVKNILNDKNIQIALNGFITFKTMFGKYTFPFEIKK